MRQHVYQLPAQRRGHRFFHLPQRGLLNAQRAELSVSLLAGSHDLGVRNLHVDGLAEHVEGGLHVVVEGGCHKRYQKQRHE